MIVTCSFDGVAYEYKPTKEDTIEITRRLSVASGMLIELAQEVSTGCTFAPGVFDGERKNANWRYQELFAIDIDSGMTLDELLAVAERYNIYPAFIYETFSSEHKDRFRPVFVAPERVTDYRVRTVIQAALLAIFSKADASCQDGARMFFGGKGLLYENYGARIDLEALLAGVYAALKERDSAHLNRALNGFCELTGLNMVNGAPHVIFGEIAGSLTNLLVTNPVVSPHSTHLAGALFHFSVDENTLRQQTGKKAVKTTPTNTKVERDYEKDVVQDVDWDALIKACPVVKDFMAGGDVHHDVTWAVATNFIRLRGGESTFYEGLAKREAYDISKWQGQIAYIKKVGYLPAAYKGAKLSPYYPTAHEDTGAASIVQLAQFDKKRIQVLHTPETKDIDMVYQDVETLTHGWFEGDTPGVTVIRADTAAGKTEAMARVIDAPCIIAAPTHALKDEIAERFRAKGKVVMVAPELPASLPAIDRAIIDRYYATGMPNKAAFHLRKLARSDADVATYVASIDALSTFNGIIVCTHQRLPFLESKIHNVVIDEDILPTLISMDTVAYGDLHTLKEALKRKSGFNAKERDTDASRYIQRVIDLVDRTEGTLARLPTHAFAHFNKIEDAVAKAPKISSNVLDFLRSSCFINSGKGYIQYAKRKELAGNKRYLVLSATVNRRLYDLAFGNATYHDTPPATLKGELVQYPRYSFSRTTLKEDLNPGEPDKRLAYYHQHAPVAAPVITFKDFKHLFDTASDDLHFGKLVGIDKYAGQEIVVIGTPHYNPETYLLVAGALNAEVKTYELSEDTLEMRIINRNGFRFGFFCYPEQSILHEIQLSLIEGELIQAVGRARLARFDTRVFLFSNLPIPGATIAA